MFGRGLASLAAVAATLAVGSSFAVAQDNPVVDPESAVPALPQVPGPVAEWLPESNQRHVWIPNDATWPWNMTAAYASYKKANGSTNFVQCLIAVGSDNPNWQQEDMRYTRWAGGARCNIQMRGITGSAELRQWNGLQPSSQVDAATIGAQFEVPPDRGGGWEAEALDYYTRTSNSQYIQIHVSVTLEIETFQEARWNSYPPDCERDVNNGRVLRCELWSPIFQHAPYPCGPVFGSNHGIQPACAKPPRICSPGDVSTEDCVAADSPPAPWYEESVPEDAWENGDTPETHDPLDEEFIVPVPAQLVSADRTDAQAAVTTTDCNNSMKPEQSLLHTADGPKTVVRWRTKAVCYGATNVQIDGYSRLTTRDGSIIRATGNTCQVSNNGFPCRSKGRWVASNAKRRRHTIYAKYNYYGPPNSKWRYDPSGDKGITYKTCTGYGSPVLICDFYRWFSAGIVD